MVILKYLKYNSSILKKFTGIVYSDLGKDFLKNNLYHRYYGPAIFFNDGEKSWWFNDKCYNPNPYKYNQKQFIKDLNKKWLK